MESANTDQKVLDLTGVDLKKTVNLPQTSFPMKANLAQLEPKLLEQWEKSGIYERIREARERADRRIFCMMGLPMQTATFTWDMPSINC